MGRYIFKPKDLEPLRPFLDLPLAREVIDAAVPVKRFGGIQVEEEVTIPVEVLSRDNPDGVPLDAILAEVQKKTPTVMGIAVRGGKVFVTHGDRPKPEDREKLHGLLRDRPALLKLRRRPFQAERPEAELERILRDESTPDGEWMRAFRQYAVRTLLKER